MVEADRAFMALALRLARCGLGSTWPNPSVGAVLARYEDAAPVVVGRGWTAAGGRPHAEAVALEQAGARAAGATLYVTLEPCAHAGRAGPCAEAIVAAGVGRVVCPLGDPDPRTNGNGFARLAAAGIPVEQGLLRDEARWVARGHILRVTRGRPFVQLKLAVGSDGLMAPGDGAPVWVTGEAARARAHLLRARADAILVGRGTVAADDPALTCRLPGLEDRSPVRVVLDSALRVRPDARCLRDAERAPVWIFADRDASQTRAAALARAGAEITHVERKAPGGLALDMVLAALADRGVTRLLVEGGPQVARAFLDAGLVDEAVIFEGTAPAGAGGLAPFGDAGLDALADSGHFSLEDCRPVGSDRMRVYRRKE